MKLHIDKLTKIHGQEFRQWWQSRFGFNYDCLTSSEARYLIHAVFHEAPSFKVECKNALIRGVSACGRPDAYLVARKIRALASEHATDANTLPKLR